MQKKYPNLLIQDPIRKTSYLIPGEELKAKKTTPEAIRKNSPSTITFLIPDDDFIEEVSPFHSNSTDELKVLIQNPSAQESYLFDFKDLKKYETSNQMNYGEGYDISFIIPVGLESLNEIPILMRDLLQSNTLVGNK